MILVGLIKRRRGLLCLYRPRQPWRRRCWVRRRGSRQQRRRGTWDRRGTGWRPAAWAGAGETSRESWERTTTVQQNTINHSTHSFHICPNVKSVKPSLALFWPVFIDRIKFDTHLSTYNVLITLKKANIKPTI